MMNKQLHRQWLAGLAAAVFVIAFVAAPALAEQKFEEKFEKTIPLSKTGRLYLSNVSGDVDVMTWKDAQVKIEALKTSKAASADKAKENAAKVTIDVTGEGDMVRVETNYPKQTGGFWRGDSINVSVDYKIWVPEQASVELTAVSGDIHVAAIGGAAKIKCISGNVELKAAASADLDMVSGDLTIGNVGGDVYIKGVSGNIDVSGIKGSVDVKTVSGDIKLMDVPDAQTVGVESVSGNVTFMGVIKAGGRYELKVHSGDVRMTIPANSSFDLDAKTFSGDIDSDFEIAVSGKMSPRELHGTVGKGGATLILKSFSGNIDLKKK
jgi:DUF4097 and DUF4098 domain-containing protein YvlB